MAPGSGARLVADTLGWRRRREACAPGCGVVGKRRAPSSRLVLVAMQPDGGGVGKRCAPTAGTPGRRCARVAASSGSVCPGPRWRRVTGVPGRDGAGKRRAPGGRYARLAASSGSVCPRLRRRREACALGRGGVGRRRTPGGRLVRVAAALGSACPRPRRRRETGAPGDGRARVAAGRPGVERWEATRPRWRRRRSGGAAPVMKAQKPRGVVLSAPPDRMIRVLLSKGLGRGSPARGGALRTSARRRRVRPGCANPPYASPCTPPSLRPRDGFPPCPPSACGVLSAAPPERMVPVAYLRGVRAPFLPRPRARGSFSCPKRRFLAKITTVYAGLRPVGVLADAFPQVAIARRLTASPEVA